MEHVTDAELVALICHGDKIAELKLYTKYYKFSIKLALEFNQIYTHCGLEIDDFISLCFGALPKAINSYKGLSKSFYKYWRTICKNEVCTCLESESYYGRARALGQVSFDELIYENNDSYTNNECIGEEDREGEANLLIEDIFQYVNDPKNNFSKDEILATYHILITKLDADEVASKCNWSMAKTYKVLQHTKEKLASFLKNEYFK